jgi:hemerythrin
MGTMSPTLFCWSEIFSVGHDEIDQQHHRLFEIADTLNAATLRGDARQQLETTFAELLLYTKTHFLYEEHVMRAVGYPALAAHEREHEGLMQKVLDCQQAFRAGDTALGVEVPRFLVDWLTKHIAHSDHAVARFLLDHAIACSTPPAGKPVESARDKAVLPAKTPARASWWSPAPPPPRLSLGMLDWLISPALTSDKGSMSSTSLPGSEPPHLDPYVSDWQHQQLLRIAVNLYASTMKGQDKEQVARTLDELVAFTKRHFVFEERAMREVGYPQLASHEAEHEALLQRVLDFQHGFQAGSATLTPEVLDFLEHWIEEHVAGSDHAFGEYLNARAASRA